MSHIEQTQVVHTRFFCLGVQACTFTGLFASHRGSKGLSRCEPIRMDHGCISKWCKNKCDKINIIKPTKYFSSKVIYFPSITASEKTAIFFPIKFQQREMLLLENFTAEKGTTGITRDYSAQNSLPDPAARECQTCMASNL